MKKNVLITGTSTGVGLEAAIQFAENGYKVYATMRNIQKATELKSRIQQSNLDVEILPLDVTDVSTIQKVVDTIISQDGKIDILVNNAGAGFAKTTEQASIEEIKWVTEVNYHGVVYCTQAVLPHMRRQRSGHIICVSSVGGLVGQPFNELYCAAKFAVEGYVESLASYVGSTFNIKFTAVEPGGIKTPFMASAVNKTSVDGQLAFGEYLPIFEKYISGAQQRAKDANPPIHQTGAEVASVILSVSKMDKPPLRIRTSEWAENFCHLKTEADPSGRKLVDQVVRDFL